MTTERRTTTGHCNYLSAQSSLLIDGRQPSRVQANVSDLQFNAQEYRATAREMLVDRLGVPAEEATTYMDDLAHGNGKFSGMCPLAEICDLRNAIDIQIKLKMERNQPIRLEDMKRLEKAKPCKVEHVKTKRERVEEAVFKFLFGWI